MALLRDLGDSGGGFDWNQFQQEGQQPDMANGGYMGTGGGVMLPQVQHGPNGEYSPGQWQTMQPGMAQFTGQPAQPGAPTQGGDPQQAVMALIGGRPLTPQLLAEIKPQLAALGFKLQNDAPGRSDYRPRIQGADGSVFDLGDFGGQATWVPRGKQDWSSVGGVGGGGTLGQIGQAGGGDSRFDELRNTPGYGFAFDEGMRGVQSSAFAKGTGLTGGLLKRLQQYGSGLASQRYDTQNQQYLDWSKLGQNAINQGAS